MHTLNGKPVMPAGPVLPARPAGMAFVPAAQGPEPEREPAAGTAAATRRKR
ncbi:hypothetical protein ACQP1W_22280 [Spirillospora sp. CA-255316]